MSSTYLAEMYSRGIGVERNVEASVKHFTISAEDDIPYHQKALGDMFAEGKGVEKDLVTAKLWYEKAIANGDEDAKDSLMNLRWPLSEDKIFKSIFFSPGDGIILLVGKMDWTKDFFGISYDSYFGWPAGILSFFVWGLLLLGILDR